jgi:3'-phosphoadenosine 5'-phosphosulfate sulfotransferase (PAPS reductase)/FAD synthetase
VTRPSAGQKVRSAIDVTLAALRHKDLAPPAGSDPSILLFLSGGKDCMAGAHTVLRAVSEWEAAGNPKVHVEAVHLYVIKDLMFEVGPARTFCRKFGIPLRERPDLQRISNFASGATCMHPSPELLSIRRHTFNDAYTVALQESGCDFGFVGYKGDDNLGVILYIKQAARRSGVQGVDVGLRRVLPLWAWTGTEAYQYCNLYDLPVQALLDVNDPRGGSMGLEFTPQMLTAIKKRYPNDYEKIKAAYPLVEAVIKQAEFYGK